jgi:hypothetical protein
MKDTDRPAAVPYSRAFRGWEVPVVAMAMPVDPILMAIERYRIAYVAFAGSLNRTAEGKQHRRKVVPIETLAKPQAPAGGVYRG